MQYVTSSNVNSSGTVRLFSYSSGTIEVSNSKHDTERTIHGDNITTYTWISNGGVWAESQTWVISKDAESGKLYVLFTRRVQNEGSEPWYVFGVGTLTKDY